MISPSATFPSAFRWPLSWREFHVSRAARDLYEFDAALFATDGRLIIADFDAAHLLAQRINERRDVAQFPERAIRASHLNALGLLDEIMHTVVARYRREVNPRVLSQAIETLQQSIGEAALQSTLLRFIEEFPPLAVYRGEISALKYFEGATDGASHREIALEELLMLHLANSNAAATPLRELFDDNGLAQSSAYRAVIKGLEEFFQSQPDFGPGEGDLIALLRAPLHAVPHSLAGQLEYLSRAWGEGWLGTHFTPALHGVGFVLEEEKPTFFGPGPSHVPDYKRATLRGEVARDEPEAFSIDRHWMPEVVMLAKNAYVWLEQLCRKYESGIYSLDQIPDAELDELRAQGFTGLWLIGLWERSRASQNIKQKCGNPDAVASAYSLLSYEIAADLGGWPALENLRQRALQRGIRMASDMVPNHMGIDADWVLNHPDWFISRPQPPFPTYTFNGPNLSPREDVGIFLEDHYYSQSDAAVVFQRVDYVNADVRYIYHGNDGTLMPWNDTAQLDYLKSEVREAVLQTILHVARNFPIIRFDAAMTLAKSQFQRLWFPEPGTGGDIPSRAQSGLTMEEFDAQMPVEFWREVVDRAALETPDTLLLAEAFWMMESYFVRTLGMHRVYNSAFMNMLRDEENANYRLVIKNTLEFDPEILQRFVNFMNNPDEKTAREQFGSGDKYFGICTLMATLPGLPMFGHGQIEGFNEKYGMEYRQAKWHESPDRSLVERHEREIFPLLRKRALFAAVDQFALFDFWTSDGRVDENVFAYVNGQGDERALVIYNNRFGNTRGWLRWSAGTIDKISRQNVRRDLAFALRLTNDPKYFARAREMASGLEWLFSSRALCEDGLFIEMGAYQRHVFLDIEEMEDVDDRLAALHHEIKGRGVESIEIALRGRELGSLHAPFDRLLAADLLRRLTPAPVAAPPAAIDKTAENKIQTVADAAGAISEAPDFAAVAESERRALEFFEALALHAPLQTAPSQLAAGVGERLRRVLSLRQIEGEKGRWLREQLSDEASWSTLIGWAIVADVPRALGASNEDFAASVAVSSQNGVEAGTAASTTEATNALNFWLLDARLKRAFSALGLDEQAAQSVVDTIQTLLLFREPEAGFIIESVVPDPTLWREVFADEAGARLLGVHRHQGVLWFRREAWETLAAQVAQVALVAELHQSTLKAGVSETVDGNKITRAQTSLARLKAAAAAARYQVEALVGGVVGDESTIAEVAARD